MRQGGRAHQAQQVNRDPIDACSAAGFHTKHDLNESLFIGTRRHGVFKRRRRGCNRRSRQRQRGAFQLLPEEVQPTLGLCSGTDDLGAIHSTQSWDGRLSVGGHPPRELKHQGRTTFFLGPSGFHGKIVLETSLVTSSLAVGSLREPARTHLRTRLCANQAAQVPFGTHGAKRKMRMQICTLTRRNTGPTK